MGLLCDQTHLSLRGLSGIYDLKPEVHSWIIMGFFNMTHSEPYRFVIDNGILLRSRSLFHFVFCCVVDVQISFFFRRCVSVYVLRATKEIIARSAFSQERVSHLSWVLFIMKRI
jgi:hypothetical protein